MTEQNQRPMWKVLSVTDIPIYSPGTGNVSGKRVSFQMWDGTVSHVDIGLTEYTADKVHAAIQMAADNHQQVMAVHGPPVNYSPQQEYLPPSDIGT